MKQFIVFLLLVIQYNGYSQNRFSSEKPPVFVQCEGVSIDSLQACFDKNVFDFIYNNFEVPKRVYDENYKGELVVLFEVDTLGQFRVNS